MKRAIIICFKSSDSFIQEEIINSLIEYFKLFSNGQSDYYFCLTFNESNNNSKKFKYSLQDLLEFLKSNKYEIVNVISLFNFKDSEFLKIQEVIKKFENSFKEITLSDPILSQKEDYLELAQLFINLTNFTNLENTQFLIIGDEEPDNNRFFNSLQQAFKKLNKTNYSVLNFSAIKNNKSNLETLNLDKAKNLYILPLKLFSNRSTNKKLKKFIESILNNFNQKEINIELIPIGIGEIKSFQKVFINRLIRSTQN